MLVDRISAFVEDPIGGDFDALAADAFLFQYEQISAYRRLCESRGSAPGRSSSWREIPAVPALAFKSVQLAAAPAREVFRSSGTRSDRRSEHHHPYPGLYRRVIDASFPAACLDHPGRLPTLSLIPTREQAPDSSLAFMVEHILHNWAEPSSRTIFGPRGVEATGARSWLGARQREGRPVLILTTAFALVQLLDGLERLGLRFRLPTGSVVLETGGFKGRTREVSRDDLLDRLSHRLGLPADRVVREYGMTELTSQFYTGVLAGGDPDLFLPAPWTRVRILSPETLDEQAPGEPGLIAIFDLANLGSAIHLLTEDLGVAEGADFRLLGRAAGAELRGCSLTVEELQSTSRR
jgi:hypothetical protein